MTLALCSLLRGTQTSAPPGDRCSSGYLWRTSRKVIPQWAGSTTSSSRLRPYPNPLRASSYLPALPVCFVAGDKVVFGTPVNRFLPQVCHYSRLLALGRPLNFVRPVASAALARRGPWRSFL